MGKLVALDFNPNLRTLRRFGFSALAASGALALAAWHEALMFSAGLGAARIPLTGLFLGLGVVSCLFGVLAPSLNRGLYVGWSLLTFPLRLLTAYALLLALFFLIVTPLSLLLRGVGFDPLKRKPDTKAKSYFTPARPARSPKSYFRQY